MANTDIQTARDQFLEMAADYLLRTTPRDPEWPAYTERQLSRRWPKLLNVDHLPRDAAAPQSHRDEMRFLMTVSHLDPEHRRCLRLWVDGWSQREIAEAFNISQQFVSHRLRHALRGCYNAAPISFRCFSQHTVYRRISRVRNSVNGRRCARCGEDFLITLGCGRYCSATCQTSAELDQKPYKSRVDRNHKK